MEVEHSSALLRCSWQVRGGGGSSSRVLRATLPTCNSAEVLRLWLMRFHEHHLHLFGRGQLAGRPAFHVPRYHACQCEPALDGADKWSGRAQGVRGEGRGEE